NSSPAQQAAGPAARQRNTCHPRLGAKIRRPDRSSNASYSRRAARVHQQQTRCPAVSLPVERQVARSCCLTTTASALRRGLARSRPVASVVLAIWPRRPLLLPSPISSFRL